MWIGIIGTLLGVLVGGGLALLNTRLTFQQQVSRERQKLRLSKIEDLYQALAESRKAYEASLLERISGSLGVEVSHQIQNKVVPVERVQLLVNFYAPELLTYLNEIEKRRQEYSDVLGESVISDKSNEEEKKERRGQLVASWKVLERAYLQMQAEVVKLSRNYV